MRRRATARNEQCLAHKHHRQYHTHSLTASTLRSCEVSSRGRAFFLSGSSTMLVVLKWILERGGTGRELAQCLLSSLFLSSSSVALFWSCDVLYLASVVSAKSFLNIFVNFFVPKKDNKNDLKSEVLFLLLLFGVFNFFCLFHKSMSVRRAFRNSGVPSGAESRSGQNHSLLLFSCGFHPEWSPRPKKRQRRALAEANTQRLHPLYDSNSVMGFLFVTEPVLMNAYLQITL